MSGFTLKVAVVEDDAAIVELFSVLLAGAGHRVVYAGADADCAARLRSDPPDVVFLDMMLGGTTGDAVYRDLRSDPATSGVVVVICSVLSPGVVRDRMGVESGPAAYRLLPKPFAVAEPLALLRGVAANA